jgi:hypothetical protein
MRHYPVLTMLLATLSAACGHAPPPAPLAFEPCELLGVESPDSMGRQVHGAGFTFCLPETWRPTVRGQDSTDAKQWRGASGSVSWGLGRPRGFIGGDVVLTVTMPIVRGSNPRPIPQDPPSLCSTRKTTPLKPDGVSLIITDVECQRQWTVTALSTQPAIYVQGETRSAKVADLLERIMSTIRFPSNRR